MGAIQVHPLQTLDADEQSREELDRNFLHAGYERRVYVMKDRAHRWKPRPRRAGHPVVLAPILTDSATEARVTYQDLDGCVRVLPLSPGEYYYIAPNVAYAVEVHGAGALEVYAPTRAARPRDEERLPHDFFERLLDPMAGSDGPERIKETPMDQVLNGNPKRIEMLIINDEVETPSFLNPMTGQILVSNPVGKRIIELADGRRSVDDITDEISREFKGAPRARVRDDVVAFVTESAHKGLLTWAQ